MGAFITTHTTDDHELNIYEAKPEQIKAGLIVIQEIFGVNHHIQAVADSFAQEGYYVLAPSLFDRFHKNIQLNYSEDDFRQGFSLMNQLDWSLVFKDVQATLDLMHDLIEGKVGIVGYCWGGTVAWRCAHHLNFDAAVCYYGGSIHEHREEKPRCPVLLHFGDKDQYIPRTHIDEIQESNPEAQVHVYSADHAFNCDERGNYDPTSAQLARQRTLSFFAQHLFS